MSTLDAKTRNVQCADFEVLSSAEVLPVDNPSKTHILEPVQAEGDTATTQHPITHPMS
jgi:hypothetical protein